MVVRLRIGILVDTLLKQQHLTSMVAQSGHSVSFRGLVSLSADELPDINNDVDAWIIDTAEEIDSELTATDAQPLVTQPETALDYLLEHVTVPVVLGDSSEHSPGSEEHSAWLRRMAQRLERLSGDINLQQTHRAPVLWVLAASTGGPAAVKEFFSHLPGELGIAFIYVQHIDTNYAATLIKMMSSAGSYPAALANHGSVLQRDTIALVTAERRVDILENGTVLVTKDAWGGRYAPSIDQVVANVARTYRERSGLIIFTGMGDDGAASSRLIKQQGGQVWVQSPASCASPSMPEATMATDCVSFSGTPQELAQQLTQHMIKDAINRMP
jgi:chemosensory pili system protein ChpB (putative protein-glutamate methylesterase)